MAGRVEHRRVAVPVGEGLGQRPGRHPLELAQDPADGLFVQFGVGRLAQQILASQDLEEVELDVAQVALVMTHPLLRRSPATVLQALCYPLVTSSATRR